jgi:hypothetical protein
MPFTNPGCALAVLTNQVDLMALMTMFVLVIGIALVGSRAVLWTVLFFMTRQIVRNVNMTKGFDHDTRDLRLAAPTA